MSKRVWILVVSGILLSSIFLIFGINKMNDVTNSWYGVALHQESNNGLTYYVLSFRGDSLVINDESLGGYLDFEMSEAEVYAKAEELQAKKEKLTLKSGEFSGYRVKKNKEFYEITVPGKEGFTYTFEKIAPRKFMGEDGIRFKTSSFID
ncbi:hypothetical protein [Sporosarcina sp. A2]|uniref:hypothetical protein n=1 Tax=Sporosarcina sp. A2 TaxID=3393449 RepID=UPI003D7B385D